MSFWFFLLFACAMDGVKWERVGAVQGQAGSGKRKQGLCSICRAMQDGNLSSRFLVIHDGKWDMWNTFPTQYEGMGK